jgi:hypothetical protein
MQNGKIQKVFFPFSRSFNFAAKFILRDYLNEKSVNFRCGNDNDS